MTISKLGQVPTTYPGVPDMNHLEWLLLGDVWAFTQAEDRVAGATAPFECDPRTGLPFNQAPRPIFDPTGEQIGMTMGSLLMPKNMARGGLTLAINITLWAGSEDSESGYTLGLAASHLSVFTSSGKKSFQDVPRRDWSVEMLNTWREFAFRIRQVFARWASLGLCDPNPILYEKPEPLGLDLLPRVIRPRYALIELAKKLIPGTPWANRPHSILHDLSESERAKQPDYAKDTFRTEAGGSAPVVLKAEPTKEETSCPSSTSPGAPSETTCPKSSATTQPTSASSPPASSTPDATASS